MRVLFITPSLGIGGAERLVGSTAARLAGRGHMVAVAHGRSDTLRGPLDDAGVPALRLSDRRLGPKTAVAWVRAIRGVVASFRPDVLYVHSVLGAVVARIAAPRTPMLVTVHGIAASDERSAALLLRLVRCRVTAVSAASVDGLRRHRLAPPVDLLPPAIDIAALEAAARRPVAEDPVYHDARLIGVADAPLPGSPRICCVARQEPEKGVDVLIQAFALVAQLRAEPILHLVGAGSQTGANEALAASLGVRERCEFAGVLANAAPAFAAADIVVLPSRREGLPVVALEALALSRPVVATRVGGTPAVVRDGETGWLVPPEDPAALAAAIEAALDDPVEAMRRGAAGRALVAADYEIGRLVDSIEQLVGGLVR